MAVSLVAAPAPRRAGARIGSFLVSNWAVLLLLAAWQMWIWIGNIPSIVAPSPWSVASHIMTTWPQLLGAAGSTISIAAIGLALGVALAVVAAIVTRLSQFASGALLPIAMFAQAVPVVAMVPILARTLGYDDKTVIAIVVIISFCPTFVLFRNALRTVPVGPADYFVVAGASLSQRIVLLEVPSALPVLATALRLAAATSILAALVAEFLMGTHGLGYLIAISAPRMDLPMAWAAALTAAAISILLFVGTKTLEDRARSYFT